MANLSVATLRLRGPPSLAARATARVEDALRLATPEGERLLVLRRLALGRLPVGGRAALWEARAATALREAGSRAIHALAPGAGAAEAVWFASVAEARFLLLRELALGRRPEAWFWRLAVPDWRGLALAEWLPRLLAEALRDEEAQLALAHTVLRLVEQGLIAPLAAALAFAPPLPSRGRASPSGVAAKPVVGVTQPLPAFAARLLVRHHATIRAPLLSAIRAAPPQANARRWLARLALVAAAPELLAQPDLLVALTEAVAADPPPLEWPPPVAAGDAEPPARPTPRRRPKAPEAPPVPAPPDMIPDAGKPRPKRAERPNEEAPARPRKALPTSPPAPSLALPASTEWRSGGAGVLLLVRPLVRMGLPGWLDRHPDLAALGFARALLRHIGARMRVPPEDPLFALLGASEPQPPEVLDAWRVGLDRWLRRHTRRKLAEVARRGGWLSQTEDRIAVRFPADAADLRLRRLALDVDPGWVPWLGLAIAYHFRDDPLR